MSRFLSGNWQYLLTMLFAVAGGIWTVVTFLDRRRDELAWKRTEFLFEQAKYMETDSELSEILRILEGREPGVSMAAVIDENSAMDPVVRMRLQHSLDKLLNVFDRIAYAVFDAKTLSLKEVSVFGWYLDAVQDDTAARTYCSENGFADVIKLAEAVRSRTRPEAIRQDSVRGAT